MPSNPNTPNGREALELKGDQRIATDEQIRDHLFELFESKFYLESVRKAISDPAAWDYLKSKLPESFGVYLESLFDQIETLLADAGFEYSIARGESESDGPEPMVTRSCPIAVSLSNAKELLRAVKPPLLDLDTLQNLSATLKHLQAEIERIEGTFANFEEHIGRNQIELRVFQSEFSNLRAMEKDGSLNRSEREQKEKLQVKIEGFEREIQKDSNKLEKKKGQARNNEQKISSIIKDLSDFTEKYDNTNSGPLSKSLTLKPSLDSLDIDSSAVSTKFKKSLQAVREATFTTYHPEAERQLAALRFRKRIRKVVPAAVFGIAIAVGAALLAREQISEFINGPRPAQEKLAMRGLEVPEQAVAEELTKNNIELADIKLRILKALKSQSVAENDKQEILSAKSPEVIITKLLELLHQKGFVDTNFQADTTLHNKTYFKSELKISLVDDLRSEFGNGISVNLSLLDKTDTKDVMAYFQKQGTKDLPHQPSVTYSIDDACNTNKELVSSVSMAIHGKAYFQTHYIRIRPEVYDQACKDVVKEAHEPSNQETELLAAKGRLKKYIQEHLSENLLPLVDEAKNMTDLGAAITKLTKGVVYKNYTGTKITFELDPNYIELFQLVFGKDVRLFIKKVDEKTMSDRPQPVLERTFNVGELCNDGGKQIIEVVYRIGDTNMMQAFSYQVVHPDFLALCEGRPLPDDPLLKPKILTNRLNVLNHPLILKYLSDDTGITYPEFRRKIESLNNAEDLDSYLKGVVDKISKSQQLQNSLKTLLDSVPKVMVKQDRQRPDQEITLSLHPDLIRALKKEFGSEMEASLSSIIAGQMYSNGKYTVSFPAKVFCALAIHPETTPFAKITVPITSKQSLQLFFGVKTAIADHELTREVCMGQANQSSNGGSKR